MKHLLRLADMTPSDLRIQPLVLHMESSVLRIESSILAWPCNQEWCKPPFLQARVL